MRGKQLTEVLEDRGFAGVGGAHSDVPVRPDDEQSVAVDGVVEVGVATAHSCTAPLEAACRRQRGPVDPGGKVHGRALGDPGERVPPSPCGETGSNQAGPSTVP